MRNLQFESDEKVDEFKKWYSQQTSFELVSKHALEHLIKYNGSTRQCMIVPELEEGECEIVLLNEVEVKPYGRRKQIS